jgi:host factor-I protein
MEGKKAVNTQDHFLNKVRREETLVRVTLTSGEELEGVVTSFDPYALILKNTTSTLIYKHAVATIAPFTQQPDFDTFSETNGNKP